jgi:hypothetical protein
VQMLVSPKKNIVQSLNKQTCLLRRSRDQCIEFAQTLQYPTWPMKLSGVRQFENFLFHFLPPKG